jgi:hypothetical protein
MERRLSLDGRNPVRATDIYGIKIRHVAAVITCCTGVGTCILDSH